MTDTFFTSDDNIWFTPTAHARGPWSEHHCHAGPPTGLIARAIEFLVPTQRLTRLTVNLTRPVPHAGFSVDATLVRQGRTVSITTADITDGEGKVCATAHGLLMQPQEDFPFPTHQQSIGSPDDATPGPFPIEQTLHDKPAFNGAGVQTRYPEGEKPGPGPTTVWLKTVPLLPDEDTSPFQRICPLADCGNAISRNAEASEVNFMNPDLTLVLQRDPIGQWLGSQAEGYWESNGIGMADALLFDQSGVVGRAIQTLLLRPVQSVD